MANTVTKNYIPQIDYVSRDYTAILSDLTAIAKQFNPTWAVSDPADIGVALLETFAYLGDILSFYTDRMASEGFLGTASQRASVLQIAAMLGYTPTPSSAATVGLSITNNSGSTIVVTAGTQVASTTNVNGQSTQVIFETDSDLTLTASATGSVTASQGVTTTDEAVGTSDGTPSQVFKLAQNGVVVNSTGSNIIVKVGGLQYAYSSSLVDNSPYDSVFTTAMDADGYTYVVFGDGVGGRVPPATYAVTVTYRVGVGADGNVPAGSITKAISGTFPISVSQPSAATGGAFDESTDSIRYNVPRAIRTLRRAVSLKDYAYLALQVSGVSKSNADASVWSNVNLYIAPFGASAVNTYGPFTGSSSSIVTSITQTNATGGAGTGYLTYTGAAGAFSALYTAFSANPGNLYVTVSGCSPVAYNIYAPTLVSNVTATGTAFTVATSYSTFPTYYPLASAGLSVSATGADTAAFTTLKNSVISYFTDKVAPNVTLNVASPRYVPVNLEMTLRILPQYSQATVVSQVQEALSELVSYNNAFFADRLPTHFILNAITNIDGVDYATIEHLRRNSNEQVFSVTTWTTTSTTATLNFPNTHNMLPGQTVRVANVGSVDGTYAINSVTGTSITVTATAGTVATPTGVTGNTVPGFTVVSVSSTTGLIVGMNISGGTIPGGSKIVSFGVNYITIDQFISTSQVGATLTFTYAAITPIDTANSVRVITVDSTTSSGVTNYGITCAVDEIPTKGTFTITAVGGLT
jgi:hypothetical protein